MTFVAGTVLTAAALNTGLAAKTDTAMTQNAQTGTSYSYVLLDAAKLLTMNNAASNTVTVTKQATVTWVTGTQLRIMNLGAGVTTLVADTGVTINGNVSLKQYQGGTLIRTGSDVWLFVPTASSSGMDLITPTSVAGSGVTLSGGQVTFTAATAVSVNGCFTSAYDNYRIVISGLCSDFSGLDSRLRLSGTDSSVNYNGQTLRASSTSVSAASGPTNSANIGAIHTTQSIITIDLAGPAKAQQTAMYAIAGAGGPRIDQCAAFHTAATAYDGITVLPDVGTSGRTITGTLRVYGLRNS